MLSVRLVGPCVTPAQATIDQQAAVIAASNTKIEEISSDLSSFEATLGGS